MMIKAVCFDADGVVVNPQMQFAALRETRFGISKDMAAPFYEGIFNECLTGKADLMMVLPPFLKQWNWEGSVEEFVALWLKTEHLIDARLISTIKKLREDGIICCLATSQEQHRADYMKKEMGFQDIFDHMFFSCEMGAQKPDEDFFRLIETRLQLPGESILFWDDRSRNVDGARARGWKAEVYINYPLFIKELLNHIPL